MFAKIKNPNREFVVLFVFVLAGCGANDDKPKYGNQMNTEPIPLIQRNSGYVGDVSEWREFLSCWHSSHLLQYRKTLIKYPSMPYMPVIVKDTSVVQKRVTEDDIYSTLAVAEERLGVVLPKSYKDFIQAYQPTESKKGLVDNAQSSVGLYAPSEIGKFGQLMPKLAEDLERFPIDADDVNYNHYGVGQDDAQIRTQYIRDLIIVGRYGSSNFEVILLYPQIKTSDGEMQAGLRFHSGEYRAPSFAELMRQLSVLETIDVEHVPPYPQTMLKGLCAEKLTLRNIWWR